MATLDFKQTHSWQDAIELGVALVTLAEALPDNEQTGLGNQLHQLALDLASQVSADLNDSTKTRFMAVYRLASALELVERIYPALDTAQIHTKFEQLVTRLESDDFSEVIPVSQPVVVSEPEVHEPAVAEAEPTPEPVAAEPVRETSFPVSPSMSQVSSSPSGIPILGMPVASSGSPDISGLPEGVSVTNHETTSVPVLANSAPVEVTPVTQAVDVQPNSLQ